MEQQVLLSASEKQEGILSKRLERLDTRFDLVEERLDDVEDRLHCLEEMLGDLDNRGMEIQEGLEDTEGRLLDQLKEIKENLLRMDENFRALLCICARQGLKLEKLENRLRHSVYTDTGQA